MTKLSGKKKKRIRWIILLGLFSLLLIALLLLAPKAAKLMRLSREAKALAAGSSTETFKESKTTVIYDANGELLCTMKNSKDMYYVDFDEIPTTLKQAFITMEDREFYSHSGIDYKAIVRALIANSQSDEIVQGASTITQQLARNIFLTQEVTWDRKIEEIFLAMELEKRYSKDQILEFYLNNIYFGNGYYGVEAAARGYFDKSVGELSLSEQVFIAAVPNNPTRYDPYNNFDNTVERRNLILQEMYALDYINTLNYYTAKDESISLAPVKVQAKNNSVETYARHCATEELMLASGFLMQNNFNSQQECDTYDSLYQDYYTQCQQKLFSGGYSIYTSIEMDAQRYLQESIDNNLSSDTSMRDGVYELQAAAACIDNATGNVVAIVGSRSQELEGYTLNRAYQSFRQAGSAIKPISVYLPYLQQGNTPATIVTDEPIAGGPANADGYYGGDMTLRDAVRWSKNTVAWRIYQEITPAAGISFLINMGFNRVWMDKQYTAAALGGFTYGVSAEEMAGAYATIANDGEYRRATCIVKMYDASGRCIVDTSGRNIRIYDINSCRMMTSMLKTVVESGTGVGAIPDNAVVAGKTGTTNSNNDAWFCGYSRYYTTAVWLGYDYPRTLTNIRTKEIFHDFMTDMHDGLAKKEFDTYPGSASETATKETETEEETVEETEEETIEGTIEETVDGTIEETVDGAVDGTIEETVDGAVDGTIEETVDGTVDGTIEETVDGTIEETTETHTQKESGEDHEAVTKEFWTDPDMIAPTWTDPTASVIQPY